MLSAEWCKAIAKMGFDLKPSSSLLLMFVSVYFFAHETAVLLMVPLPGNEFENKSRLMMAFLASHVGFALFGACFQLKEKFDKSNKVKNTITMGSAESRNGETNGAVAADDKGVVGDQYKEECRRECEMKEALEEALEVLRKERGKYEEERVEWERRRFGLELELDTVRKCAELYRGVLHDCHWFGARDD